LIVPRRRATRTGTTGDGYGWLAELGLPIVEPVPALVPLSSPATWVRGSRACRSRTSKRGSSTRRDDARAAAPAILFRIAVSGPGAMDLSTPVARAEAVAKRTSRRTPVFHLVLDLVPDLSREALRDVLVAAAGAPGAPTIAHALPSAPPRRVMDAVARRARIESGDIKVNRIDREGRHLPRRDAQGPAGRDRRDARVRQCGGDGRRLALSHVDPGTMRVRGFENLFACGEILDLAGPIGGLNFQAAFATAEIAARSV
jgi:predicted flavoprotein YhiN